MKLEYSFKDDFFSYRTITEDDAEIIVRWRSNPEIIRYYCNTVPVSMESHLEWYRNKYLINDSRYDFLIFHNDIPIGFSALTDIDFCEKSALLNYTIGNFEYRGKGLSEKIIGSMLEFGNKEFNIKNFIAVIHKENIMSQHSAASQGFVLYNKSKTFYEYRRKIK